MVDREGWLMEPLEALGVTEIKYVYLNQVNSKEFLTLNNMSNAT